MTSIEGSRLAPGGQGGHCRTDGQNVGAFPTRPAPRTAAEIEDWFLDVLSRELRTPRARIDVTAPFEAFGLDSVAAVGLTGALEDWLGRPVDPMVVYDYPTIEALAKHLAEQGRPSQDAS